MLTVYLSPGSSSMAPHIALHEIGVPFESRWISFAKKEQHSPEYLTVNPEGKVPTLLVDGRPMTEVAGVLYYLARTYPEAGLGRLVGPRPRRRRSRGCRSSPRRSTRRAGTASSAGMRCSASPSNAWARREWTVGRYSIADIHLFRLYWRFVDSLHPAPQTYPGLSAHYDRMMARRAVQKTLEIEAKVGYQLPQ